MRSEIQTLINKQEGITNRALENYYRALEGHDKELAHKYCREWIKESAYLDVLEDENLHG